MSVTHAQPMMSLLATSIADISYPGLKTANVNGLFHVVFLGLAFSLCTNSYNNNPYNFDSDWTKTARGRSRPRPRQYLEDQ